MEIKLKRIADNGDASISLLYIDDEFQCFVIEDEKRTKKVYAETRIPKGVYNIGLRKEGGFHNRYSNKFKDHKGMLCLYNKPNWTLVNAGISFQYILIHIGNTQQDTAGCLLLNDVVDASKFTGSYSTQAYKRIYPIIANHIEECGPIEITVE
jgi:hypothetical protein